MRGTVNEGVSLGCGLAAGCCVFAVLAVVALAVLASLGTAVQEAGQHADTYEERGKDARPVP